MEQCKEDESPFDFSEDSPPALDKAIKKQTRSQRRKGGGLRL